MASCSKVTTRLTTRRSIFDQPEKLRELQLPVKEDFQMLFVLQK